VLAYRSAGTGTPLVLLHAYPLSSAMWDGELKALSRLARVLAPDLPGFGRSSRQRKPSMAAMAQALRELLDSLSVREPVFLGGLSMGGYVAFEFVRQYPDRVRALGLFSTRAIADTPVVRRGRLQTASKIRAEGLEGVPETILPKLLGASALGGNASLKKSATDMILQNDREGVADALLAMAERSDSTGLLASVRCPCLVVAGDEDALIPLEEARGMHQGLKDSRLEVIQGAGHLTNLERPEVFRGALEQFLKERVLNAHV